jgi:2-polyprenyl-3-methyl-5-hydroxy-6-metoxy-1,4-benzoquinol methylase
MNKKEVKSYIKYLKFHKFEMPKKKNCEICDNKKTRLLQRKISWNNNKFGILPVHCCLKCGFVFQNPRFSKKFYFDYYKKTYRDITLKTQIPPKIYLKDQRSRGEKLYKFIKNYLPKKGSMVDLGCSVGLMMKPFLKNGWKCQGSDPIKGYAEYGKNKFKLPVQWMQSEDMELKKNSLDLIIIMGSLEHVTDVNVIMKKCAEAAKKNCLLVLEARGDPLGNTKGFFNQSHHRYFFGNTFELTMIKHGFNPFLTTKYPITGETRENTIFCLGRFEGKKISKNFKSLIKNGKRETYEDVVYKLKYHDYLAKRNPGKLLLR